MKNLFLLLFLFCGAAAGAQIPQTSAGAVQRFENFPSEFVPARNVDVWLPENYDSTKKYAVLYLHDGQMLFDSAITWNRQEWGVDETVSRLLAEKQIRDCIVVGIWNGGALRHSEYFPQKPFESLPPAELETVRQTLPANRQEAGKTFTPTSDNYLKFLVTELKPFIDSRFSTHRDRQNTFVGGSSMGGLISMYAICEYPRVFGGAACLSTHWPGVFTMENNPVPDAFLRYLDAHLPDPKSHKIYFDYGTATLDSLYEVTQFRVDTLMARKGFDPQHWMTQKFPGADHSERAWRARLAVPVAFLLPKIFYPKYEGNPIVWQGERYFGNVKSVEEYKLTLNDTMVYSPYDLSRLHFNKEWEVIEQVFYDHKNQPKLTIRPMYGYGNKPVVENRVNPDGELNNVVINEFRQGILTKSSRFSSMGTPGDVTDYIYQGDSTISVLRYYNSLTHSFDDEGETTTITVRKGDHIVSIVMLESERIVFEQRLLDQKLDKYGNWIEKKWYAKLIWTNGLEEGRFTNRRIIEYYPD